MLLEYGLQVVGALVILIVGWVGANWVSKKVRKLSQRTDNIDDTLTPILVKTARISILAITVLVVLNQFGVQTASIIAVLGTIGLAIGLALQGTLSNIASGMMLLLLRPFDVGDSVDIGGKTGVVEEIGLFVTEMNTFDNIAITMPNSRIWGNTIENYTRNNTRRINLKVGISYDDDIDRAQELLREILNNDDRVLPEPQPLVEVGELGDNSVVLYVRPWAAIETFWPLYYDLVKTIKQRFDQEGISFPYPQRDVHLFQSE